MKRPLTGPASGCSSSAAGLQPQVPHSRAYRLLARAEENLHPITSAGTRMGANWMPAWLDTVYRLIPQKDRHISVEMAKPNGRRRVIQDFVDEAEASAWTIQTKR